MHSWRGLCLAMAVQPSPTCQQASQQATAIAKSPHQRGIAWIRLRSQHVKLGGRASSSLPSPARPGEWHVKGQGACDLGAETSVLVNVELLPRGRLRQAVTTSPQAFEPLLTAAYVKAGCERTRLAQTVHGLASIARFKVFSKHFKRYVHTYCM